MHLVIHSFKKNRLCTKHRPGHGTAGPCLATLPVSRETDLSKHGATGQESGYPDLSGGEATPERM